MASLRETLKTTLENDGTLTALLTGGVFDADDLDMDGGGASSAPREADGVTLKPFATIRWRISTPTGPETVRAEGETVEIYLYQNRGYATIEQAVSRVKVLLHRQALTASDRSLAYFNQMFVSGELPAVELGGAACRFCRYQVTGIRK